MHVGLTVWSFVSNDYTNDQNSWILTSLINLDCMRQRFVAIWIVDRNAQTNKKGMVSVHGPQKSKSVLAVNRQNAARSDAPSCGVKWATACNVII